MTRYKLVIGSTKKEILVPTRAALLIGSNPDVDRFKSATGYRGELEPLRLTGENVSAIHALLDLVPYPNIRSLGRGLTLVDRRVLRPNESQKLLKQSIVELGGYGAQFSLDSFEPTSQMFLLANAFETGALVRAFEDREFEVSPVSLTGYSHRFELSRLQTNSPLDLAVVYVVDGKDSSAFAALTPEILTATLNQIRAKAKLVVLDIADAERFRNMQIPRDTLLLVGEPGETNLTVGGFDEWPRTTPLTTALIERLTQDPRKLELGLGAGSADCYLVNPGSSPDLTLDSSPGRVFDSSLGRDFISSPGTAINSATFREPISTGLSMTPRGSVRVTIKGIMETWFFGV